MKCRLEAIGWGLFVLTVVAFNSLPAPGGGEEITVGLTPRGLQSPQGWFYKSKIYPRVNVTMKTQYTAG